MLKKIALVRKSKEEKAKMLADAKVLTVSELSEYLRVHRSTIYRLLKKGQLPGFKIGSDWRFNVEAIDQWRMQQGAAQLEELRNAAGN
ncbi:MAG TPA: helix-turn-helix domain-containing protein [Candidatus Binataceae bacterium]|nr:helix-turn-helix domain-containing protein [Candidatus Binataceae bacterium]